MELSGNIVALVTPFCNGALDEPALGKLIDHVIEGGVDALVPCGTTGESPTLTHAEHDRVIESTIAKAGARVPVIAGAGSNSTAEAVRLSRAAAKAGARAILSVNPYYNRPSQDGLRGHFLEIAEASTVPVVLYNIPGRTGVELSRSTIASLAEHDNIQAIKEATGRVDSVAWIRSETGLAVLSGDDALTLPMLALGARGVISVASNLLPQAMTTLVQSGLAGDMATARATHDHLLPLFEALTLEVNPLPIKTALAMWDRIGEEFRSPLTPMTPETRARLSRVLARYRD